MAITTTTDERYWLIERGGGDTRYIWGPYTRARARREAGRRHAIFTGSGLADGDTIGRGQLRDAIRSGRLHCESGDHIDSF